MTSSKIFYGFSISIVLLTLFLYFFHPIPLDLVNSDLGRHLVLGKLITTSGQVPTVNLLSYSNHDYPFINTHWLSEVIFYLCYTIIGFNGLILLSVLLITFTFLPIFISCLRNFDKFSTTFIAFIYLPILSARTEIRPELFSFLFLSIFILILYKYRQQFTKWIFLLIPLELLWVNLHIYFFVGLAVLGLFLFDAFILKKSAFISKKFLTLLVVTIAAGLVTLVNPNLIKGETYPLFVFNNYNFLIVENLNFFAASNLVKTQDLYFFGGSAILLWICIFIALKKMTLIDILLSLFFTVMGLFAIRDFPLFVLGVFIPSVKVTSQVMLFIFNKISKKNIFILKILLLSTASLLLIFSIKLNIEQHGLGVGVNDNAQNAVQFLIKNNLKGPIFNDYDIGNYLDYRLYPKENVFVDNRPEAYPKEFFQNIYFPMRESLDTLNQGDKKYNFNIIFFDHTDTSTEINKLFYQLARSDDWKMVYLDSLIVIFIKNTPANQQFIKAHLITPNNIIISKEDYNDKKKVGQLIEFFMAVGWPDMQLKMALQYLNFDPKNCSLLRDVVILMQQKNSPLSSIYSNQYIQFCQNNHY